MAAVEIYTVASYAVHPLLDDTFSLAWSFIKYCRDIFTVTVTSTGELMSAGGYMLAQWAVYTSGL